MFTTENTEGFTGSDIATLNTAADIIAARNPDMTEDGVSDAINNAWVGGQTAEELANATGL